ncbi:MAG: (5-formylfuran-3-yl)methyl phosphate synthase [Methyloceanibacter sp.]
MTLFLASVRSGVEAETALASGADIIDLKDPGGGALGALDLGTIKACVDRIAGRAPVSATIGDLPLQGDLVGDAVRAVARLGVDYVKLGLFPGGHAPSCLSRLAGEARTVPLILVVFADAWPTFDAVAEAARIGAHGVMLDTAGKGSGSLPDHISRDKLAGFICAAKAEGLSVGLAGALRAEHVPELLSLKPDLLGFRGALCRGGSRDAPLDPAACASIRALIPRTPQSPAIRQIPEPHAAASC